MNQFKLGSRSRRALQGVHKDLVGVVEMAIMITEVDFTVYEGLRTIERQKELIKLKKSWTLNSRHLTGHAVDMAPWIDGKIPWEDHAAFEYLAKIMFRAAHLKDTVIEWGGSFGRLGFDEDGEKAWLSRFDGPHFQMPWATHPHMDDAA